MKPGGQKRKGSAYERVIAKLFTEQYYSDDGEFRRVPLSGGWDKRVVPGDLMALKYSGIDDTEGLSMIIDKTFPFSIECKNYRDENVKHFFSGLYSNKSQMFDWLEQAENDASPSNKYPLVVFKLYGSNNIVMTNDTTFHGLRGMFGLFPGNYFKLALCNSKGYELTESVFFLLDDFFEWVDWGVFKTIAKAQYIKSLIKVKPDS